MKMMKLVFTVIKNIVFNKHNNDNIGDTHNNAIVSNNFVITTANVSKTQV